MKYKFYLLITLYCFLLLPKLALLQVNNQLVNSYLSKLVVENNVSTLYNQLDSLNKLKGLNPANNAQIKVQLAREAIRLQKFPEALQLSYEGIEIAKKYQLDSIHAAFYKGIGSVSYFTGKLQEAINYFKKSASIAKSKNIIVLEAANYQNIGGVSIDNKQVDSAYKYLNLAIVISNNCEAQCSKFRLMAIRLLATLYD